jgi:hypothetical protein
MARQGAQPRQPFISDDETRSYWVEQAKHAERTFQDMREDIHLPSPIEDEERRALLEDLADSCRQTAELLARAKEVFQGFTILEKNLIRKHSLGRLMEVVSALHPYLHGTEQTAGVLETGLDLLARYCVILRERKRGPHAEYALDDLIHAKLRAWFATHGTKNICYTDRARGGYRGLFLDKMERTLEDLGYRYPSREGLAKRIKRLRSYWKVYTSLQQYLEAEQARAAAVRRCAGEPHRT